MYLKVLAALSAFLFIPLAAIFGTSGRLAQADLVTATLSVLLFVVGTSFLLGIIFGRTALRSATIFGGLALFVMWLPFQYYATEESLYRSAIALLPVVFMQVPPFFVGAMVRTVLSQD